MKHIYTVIFIFVLIIGLSGCEKNKITGDVVSDLTKDFINNGEIINLKVDGKNTGNVAANVVLNIIPEDPNLLKISYPGLLEDTLQPNEQIGTKIITIQGFTQHSQTKLWIKTQLINKDTNKILDEDIQWLTIKK